jgi:hypothetical protein
MTEFGSASAIFLLFIWIFAAVALILSIIQGTRTAGLIILSADVLIFALITLSFAGVLNIAK